MSDAIDTANRSAMRNAVLKRGAFFLLGGIALYILSPQLVDVFSQAPELRVISFWWFVAMFVLQTGSLAAAWGLARLAVDGLTWFASATSQLASNAAGKIFPGGAVFGGAVYFRMLSTAGTDPGSAAAGLAVNSIISTAVLFALPAFAALAALVTAPIPEGLVPVAVAGFVLFAVLVIIGLVLGRSDRALLIVTKIVGGAVSWTARLFKKSVRVSPRYVIGKRNEVLDAVDGRWGLAVVYAALNWILDYLTLLAALYAIGHEPRFSVVLLAFAASAVLSMIPITPGGLGFVEAGLTATLVVAGVPAQSALLATLAYRLFSFWLPIPIGGIAYVIHRRKFGAGVESRAT